ncbi:MAG: hypothetical protein AB7P20_02565 [Rhizobiaceae bacterium]
MPSERDKKLKDSDRIADDSALRKTGMALVEAIQAIPDRELDFDRPGLALPVSAPVRLH